MLDSTLTPDRATPMLLLMKQSLYKWKPYKVVCVCVTNGHDGGYIGSKGWCHCLRKAV
jgi:hypothetical protein